MRDIHSARFHLLEDISANFSSGVGEQHADKRLMEGESRFQVGDMVKVISKGYAHYGDIGEVVDLSPQDGSFVTVEFSRRSRESYDSGGYRVIYHESQLEDANDEYDDQDEDQDDDLVYFYVNGEELDDILHDRFGNYVDRDKDAYVLPGEIFDRFNAYASRKHLDSQIHVVDDNFLEEIAANDPILVAMRARQMAADRDKSIEGGAVKKSPTKSAILMTIRNLKRTRARIEREMEQEAEPSGGPIADEYGEKLNNIDAEIRKFTQRLKLFNESKVNETFTQEDYAKAAEILDKIKSTSSKLYSALIQMIMDTHPHSGDEIDTAVSKFGLNESYSKFKKETSQRARKKQYYEGLKMAESKMKEAKSIVEYVSRLKEEMSGELPLEENSFMRKLKERMTRTIAEMYSKYKSL